MALSDEYVPAAPIGSTDWNGGAAPAGGSHTGVSQITMTDGTTHVVAHGVAEVQRKRDSHANAPPSPALVDWIAFDVPNVAVPIVLRASGIQSVDTFLMEP